MYFFKKKNNNFKILITILFLSSFYKIHLAVNILKETLILFFLVLCVLYSNILTYVFSFIMGTSLRTLFGLYFLNFVDFKNLISKNNFLILENIYLFYFLFCNNFFFSLDNFFLSLFEFVNQRNVSDMGGKRI